MWLTPHQAAVAPTASQASAAAAGTRYSTRPSSDRPRSAAPPQPQPRPRPSLTLAIGRRRSPPPGTAAAGDIAAPRRGEDLNIPACTAPRGRHRALAASLLPRLGRARGNAVPQRNSRGPIAKMRSRWKPRSDSRGLLRLHPHSTHPEVSL